VPSVNLSLGSEILVVELLRSLIECSGPAHGVVRDGGPRTPLGDKFELLPDSSVAITGRHYDDVEGKKGHAWKANGKVASDEVSP
jgi:hypothetical protein